MTINEATPWWGRTGMKMFDPEDYQPAPLRSDELIDADFDDEDDYRDIAVGHDHDSYDL